MKWLENIVLQTKLVMLTTIILIGLVTVSVIAVNSVKSWQTDVKEIGSVRVPSLVGLLKMRTGINKVIIEQNRARGCSATANNARSLRMERIRKEYGFLEGSK